MKEVFLSKPFDTEEEYFAFEEKSELRNEYINKTLFAMSGASKHHHKIVRQLNRILERLLPAQKYEIFTETYKVRTPDKNFFYPDVIVSELQTAKFYTERPLLLVEVLSDTTRIFDLTDKFIQYRKFATLQYYLCVEPEQVMVHLYYRTDGESYRTDDEDDAEWQASIYVNLKDIIHLPKLGISICLADIYKG